MAEPRQGREGSRWYNASPTAEELKEWFEANVEIEDGLEAADYLSGIVMIPQEEKSKQVTGFDPDNHPLISDVKNLVYIPYAKVETRVKYFHDLMAAKRDEWIGVIEPVPPAQQDPRLPEGFFSYLIPTGENRGARYICCTMKVTVYKREGFEEKRVLVDTRKGLYETIRVGEKILDAPPATKMVPTTRTWRSSGDISADDSALMKAETGAIGRALGFAGILVIPGSGVASAEDMNEALGAERAATTTEPAGPGGGEGPTAELPSDEGKGGGPEELAALRAEAADAINRLSAEKPQAFKLFQAWAQERGVGRLADVADPAVLRGLTAKANRDYEEAEA